MSLGTIHQGTIHTVYIENVKTRDSGESLTGDTAVVKVKVLDRSGITTFSETAWTYVKPGTWTGDVPASAFVLNSGPWIIEAVVYDLAGVTPRLTRRYQVNEED